jgi:hypothetical protein
MYNHAFMAVGTTPELSKTLAQNIRRVMWSTTVGGEIRNKRRQVAFKRIFASHEMGGLNIAHPDQVNEGLMLNTLERIIIQIRSHEDSEKLPNIARVLHGIAQYRDMPDLSLMFDKAGPTVWANMANRVYEHNAYLGGCFLAYAKLMRKLSTRSATWSSAGLWGHANVNPVLPVSEADMNILNNCGIQTVGQIYDNVDGTALHSHLPLKARPEAIPRDTWSRVHHIHSNITRLPIIRGGVVSEALNVHTIRRTGTFSQVNRVLYTESIEKEIRAPPSYFTRQRDNLPLPSNQDYCRAFDSNPTATSPELVVISNTSK